MSIFGRRGALNAATAIVGIGKGTAPAAAGGGKPCGAENRGIEPDAVRDMEAATFTADDALRLGLVDAVMAPEDAFAALVASL